MTNPKRQTNPSGTRAATYRIRVATVLGEEWSGRARGMSVSVHHSETEDCHTELIGELSDEAALMGVLEALYDHGARLLSVDHLEEEGSISVRHRDGN